MMVVQDVNLPPFESQEAILAMPLDPKALGTSVSSSPKETSPTLKPSYNRTELGLSPHDL